MNIEYVIKRNNAKEKYNPEKVEKVVWAAVKSVGGKDKEKFDVLMGHIFKNLKKEGKTDLSVDTIQDIIENTLIKRGHDEVAKSFILYRNQHTIMRNFKNILEDTELIDKYLGEDNWRIKENSNMGYSLQGLNNNAVEKIMSTYWLNKVIPPEASKLHYDGDVHIHDLGSLSAYCVGMDLKDLLLNGFGGVSSKVESAPPKHFRSALGQIVNMMYTIQGEVSGAVAFSNFDTYLAPFIREDGLTKKEVKQALQEFIFNMNVPTRVGFQSPFSNITLDLTIPKHMAKLPVIIGGKIIETAYEDYQEEMDLFNDVIFEVYTQGDKTGKVFTFPIPTINIDDNFDWDNPAHKNLWFATAKYGIPYFGNYMNSDMSAEDTTSMCCRLRIDHKELNKRGGGVFSAAPLTGSISVFTINMSRVGYLATTEHEFFTRLDKLMDNGANVARLRRKNIERWTENNLYPYCKFYLRQTKAATGEYWHNHFNTIGLNGMNEACLNFLGKDILSKKGKEFAIKVLKHMRARLEEYKAEDGQEWNLEETPAEGASRRFAQKDKEKFNDIIVANEENYQKNGAVPYYTNSSHTNVNSGITIFKLLDHQNDIKPIYNGGTVSHIFLGERAANGESVKQLIKRIFTNYQLPYISITPSFSVCPIHGYITGEHHICPKCLTSEDILPIK